MEFAEEFGQLRGDFGELRGEFRELRGEMRALRGELRGEIGELRGEIAKSTLTIVYVNTFTMIGVAGLVLAATQIA